MTEYKKPAMMALSLSANDSLCGCDIKTRGSTDYFINLLTEKFGGDDGLLDPSDNVFTTEESCANSFDGVIDGYCKFNAEGGVIFTS